MALYPSEHRRARTATSWDQGGARSPLPRNPAAPIAYVGATVAPLIITEALFAASCSDLDDKWLYPSTGICLVAQSDPEPPPVCG